MVRRLQLGCHVGRPLGVGRASPCSLLATQHQGPAVTAAEGLGWLGLAGEQPLLLVFIPQVLLQLLLLLLFFPFPLEVIIRGHILEVPVAFHVS